MVVEEALKVVMEVNAVQLVKAMVEEGEMVVEEELKVAVVRRKRRRKR